MNYPTKKILLIFDKVKRTFSYINKYHKSAPTVNYNKKNIVYHGDKTCNLALVFLVLCHRQQMNHLDTSCSFQPRDRDCQNKIHL